MKAVIRLVRLGVVAMAFMSCDAGSAVARVTPEAFLASAPAAPQDCCDLPFADKAAFLAKVERLLAGLEDEIAKKRDETQAYMEERADDVKRHHLARTGISESEAERLSQAGEAEQLAVAEAYLQQHYNISIADVKKLEGMSEEQQAAWAQSHAGQMMSQAQAGTHKGQSGRAELQALASLAQEQQDIVARLTDGANRVAAQFAELENDPEAQRIRETEIMPLEARMMAMIGAGGQRAEAEMDRVRRELKDKKRAYCARYYPRHRAAYHSYLAFVKGSLPAYHRLESLQAAALGRQAGIAGSLAAPGTGGLEAVHDYVRKLREVFTYDLRTDMDM
jgi:hypothetical protein